MNCVLFPVYGVAGAYVNEAAKPPVVGIGVAVGVGGAGVGVGPAVPAYPVSGAEKPPHPALLPARTQ